MPSSPADGSNSSTPLDDANLPLTWSCWISLAALAAIPCLLRASDLPSRGARRLGDGAQGRAVALARHSVLTFGSRVLAAASAAASAAAKPSTAAAALAARGGRGSSGVEARCGEGALVLLTAWLDGAETADVPVSALCCALGEAVSPFFLSIDLTDCLVAALPRLPAFMALWGVQPAPGAIEAFWGAPSMPAGTPEGSLLQRLLVAFQQLSQQVKDMRRDGLLQQDLLQQLATAVSPCCVSALLQHSRRSNPCWMAEGAAEWAPFMEAAGDVLADLFALHEACGEKQGHAFLLSLSALLRGAVEREDVCEVESAARLLLLHPPLLSDAMLQLTTWGGHHLGVAALEDVEKQEAAVNGGAPSSAAPAEAADIAVVADRRLQQLRELRDFVAAVAPQQLPLVDGTLHASIVKLLQHFPPTDMACLFCQLLQETAEGIRSSSVNSSCSSANSGTALFPSARHPQAARLLARLDCCAAALFSGRVEVSRGPAAAAAAGGSNEGSCIVLLSDLLRITAATPPLQRLVRQRIAHDAAAALELYVCLSHQLPPDMADAYVPLLEFLSAHASAIRQLLQDMCLIAAGVSSPADALVAYEFALHDSGAARHCADSAATAAALPPTAAAAPAGVAGGTRSAQLEGSASCPLKL
ncbi:hypothetical protein cyc_05206 [Cyclospora cayetanensis]|uniref:Uncharacterized protein n=1 Tax=Cyclospora cayetanensis TaxID=88456 RepID=A0A1D3CSN8_9EIME|nr:hypothetical protein cyc_05206 [Cyclospora cayetanensis]